MTDSVIRRVTEAGPVHDEREIEAVLEVLRTTRLDLGPRVESFEQGIATLLAKRHGVTSREAQFHMASEVAASIASSVAPR